MSNQNYIIRAGSVNPVSETAAKQYSEIKPPVSDLGPITSEGVNFKIRTGFNNLKTDLPFSVSLSSNIVDFGVLSPTNPIVRTVDLSTNALGVYGYSIIVFEDKPLTATTSNSKIFIPDTTCDKGICGVESSAEWINTLTYGFGYRCDDMIGISCDDSFARPNYYKHFPNLASNDDPQPVVSGVNSSDKAARISYKVNISGDQAQGNYENTVTYIGIPNF